MEIEVGQIVKLSIPHFKKDRYYLVYQIDEVDHFLANITGKDKRESVNPIPQCPLNKEIDPEIESLINSNTKIFIRHELFFKLIENAPYPQQNKLGQPLPSLSEQEVNEIRKSIDDCFKDNRFRGNRYKVRIE